MIDIKTLGTSLDSVVLSIGAVKFDLAGRGLSTEFHERLNVASQEYAGRRAYGDTAIWWLKQSNDAQKMLLSMPETGVCAALAELRNFCDGAEGVWGNGTMFDNAIVKDLCKSVGVIDPWHYRLDRCYRTLKSLVPHIKPPEHDFVAHDALEDAKHQALHLQLIAKELGLK